MVACSCHLKGPAGHHAAVMPSEIGSEAARMHGRVLDPQSYDQAMPGLALPTMYLHWLTAPGTGCPDEVITQPKMRSKAGDIQ